LVKISGCWATTRAIKVYSPTPLASIAAPGTVRPARAVTSTARSCGNGALSGKKAAEAPGFHETDFDT
jgi:hypothetical protein